MADKGKDMMVFVDAGNGNRRARRLEAYRKLYQDTGKTKEKKTGEK